MPTFPRGFMNHLLHADNAALLEQLARDTGGNLTQERAAQRTHPIDPADNRTLRGIPAIGKGVAGVSPGTRPDAICHR